MRVDNSVLIEMLPGVMRAALKEDNANHEAMCVDTEDLNNNAQTTTITHGNFTIAMINYEKKVFVGEAKRNPRDTPNAKRGERLALSRALKALLLNKE